jgi:hypothetical protein
MADKVTNFSKDKRCNTESRIATLVFAEIVRNYVATTEIALPGRNEQPPYLMCFRGMR